MTCWTARLAWLLPLVALACATDPDPTAPGDAGRDVSWFTGTDASEVTAPLDVPPVDVGPEIPVDVLSPLPGTNAGPWPLRGHDPARTGRTALSGATSATLRWKTPVSDSVRGSAVVAADGTIVVGGASGNVTALGSDGVQRWFYSADGPVDGGLALGADGVVYFGSRDKSVYALNPNGTLRWKVTTEKDVVAAPAITVTGDVVIGSTDGKLYRIGFLGDLKGTTALGGAIASSAAVTGTTTERLLVGCDDGKLYAIEDGKVLWTHLVGGEVRAPPTVRGDGVTLVASLDKSNALHAVKPDGTLAWKVPAPAGIDAGLGLLADDGVLAATIEGDVLAVAPDGTTRWTVKLGGAVRGGFAVSGDGRAFVGGHDQRLVALDARPGGSGAILWSLDLGGLVWSAPALTASGSVIVAGDATVFAIGGGSKCEGTPLPCDDADPCTIDTCEGDACMHRGLCDDANACTTDTCDATGKCGHAPAADGGVCDDDLPCTQEGACVKGSCVSKVVLCGPAASAWPMRHHDPLHTGRTDAVGAHAGTVRWSYEVGGTVSSSPAIGPDGRVVVGSTTGKLTAVDAKGALLWTFDAGGPVTASPAIAADGTVYIGSGNTFVYALNSDGTLKWSYKTGGNVRSSPTIGAAGPLAGHVAVGSDDARLHVLRPDGKVAFVFEAKDKIAAPPAITADGRVLVGSGDGLLHVVGPDGKAVWSVSCGSKIEGSGPAIAPDGTIYVGSQDKNLYAIKPDGAVKWKLGTGNRIDATPAIRADGVIVVGSADKSFYGVKPDGTLLFSTKATGTLVSSAAVDRLGNSYVGSLNDQLYSLYAFDAAGTLRVGVVLTPEGKPFVSVYGSPAIADDGAIVVGTTDGRLVALGGGGDCEGKAAPKCDDGNSCTLDLCVSGKGCTHEALCDDGNPCTTDLCAVDGSCDTTPASDGTSCDDGLTCTTGDTCQSGSCVPAATACGPAKSAWPMHGANERHTSRAPVASAQTSNKLWTHSTCTGNAGSGPAVGPGDVAVFGCKDKNVYAVTATGETAWIFPTGAELTTTPAVTEDGLTLIGTGSGTLLAITAAGKTGWTTSAGAAIRSHPVLGAGGLVTFGTEGSALVRVGPGGKSVFTTATKEPVRSSPALLSSGAAVVGYGTETKPKSGGLIAVGNDGGVLWDTDLGTAVLMGPMIVDDGTIVVGGVDGVLRGVDLAGKVTWSKTLDGPLAHTPGLATDGTLILGQTVVPPAEKPKGYFTATDGTGTVLWNVEAGDPPSGGVALGADGRTYGAFFDGSLYIQSVAGAGFPGVYLGGPAGADPVGLAVGGPGRLLVTMSDGRLVMLSP